MGIRFQWPFYLTPPPSHATTPVGEPEQVKETRTGDWREEWACHCGHAKKKFKYESVEGGGYRSSKIVLLDPPDSKTLCPQCGCYGGYKERVVRTITTWTDVVITYMDGHKVVKTLPGSSQEVIEHHDGHSCTGSEINPPV